MEKIKLVCHVAPTFRRMVNSFALFVDVNRNNIKEFRKSNTGAECVMKDGMIHEFIPEETYPRWCEGKTYILSCDIQIYHSGYPCKLDEECGGYDVNETL